MASLLGALVGPRNDSPVPLVSRFAAGRFGGYFQRRDAATQLDTMALSGTVFGVVNRTSTAVAKTEWRLYRKAASGKDEDRTPVTSHAALDLLNKPNNFFTRMELFETAQQHLDLPGEACLIVGRDQRFRNLPLELWPVRPDRIEPVPDPVKYLAGWLYTSPDGEQVPLRTDEVIHVRMPNPVDPYRGLGPVGAVLTEVMSARFAAEWNANFFKNSAEPGGIIEIEKRLSDEEFDEMSLRWEEQHRGVARAHRVAILEQGHWVDRKYTQRDMEFSSLRGVTRDAILEAYGFPKSMLGITEDVNRANAESGEYVFAKWLTVPRLDRWRDALNAKLLPLWDSTKGLEFDYDSPVPEDEAAENAERTSKADAAQKLIAAGFDGNSVVEALDLPLALSWERPVPPAPPVPPIGPGPAGPTPVEPGAPQPADPVSAEDAVTALLGGVLRNTAPPVLNAAGWPDSDVTAVEAVDLAPVQTAWEAALAALLTAWKSTVVSDWINQLIDQVRAVLRGDGGTLATLKVDSSGAATRLVDAMNRFAETSAAHAVAEAAKHDVTLTPAWPTAADLADAAEEFAAFDAQRYALAAGREAARVRAPGVPDQDVFEHTRRELAAMPDYGSKVLLGGALTNAQNQARGRTFRSGPVGALYASEVLDSNTCLAPGALVTTRRGEVRAAEVTLDDELLTHAGRWISPSQIVISEVDEDLVVADLADGPQLQLTGDHPVLVLEGGALVWREAGQLTVGALVVGQASLEDGGELVVPDLYLRNAPHRVAAVGQIGGLSPVDVRPEAMPVGAVGFDDEPVADEEVHDPRANLGLCGEGQDVSLKAQAHSALQAGLQAAGHVAARRAVAAVLRSGWDCAELGAAMLAGDVDRGTSAGLGAVGAHGGPAVAERCTASAAHGVASAGGLGAGTGAVVVPVRRGDRNAEGGSTARTDLLDAIRPAEPGAQVWVAVPTSVGAVDGARLVAGGDHLVADLAEAGRDADAPAFEGGVAFATHALDNRYVAVDTRLVHKLSVVEVVAVQRKRYVGFVYDFTIPGDETFWTEGVLVHNCSPCREHHGRWVCNTDDLAAVYRLYPTGGYVYCLGRERCRGTVVGVWRPQTTGGQ